MEVTRGEPVRQQVVCTSLAEYEQLMQTEVNC